MLTINVAKILFYHYLFYCKISYSEDKSTHFFGNETIINCLCMHDNQV